MSEIAEAIGWAVLIYLGFAVPTWVAFGIWRWYIMRPAAGPLHASGKERP